jgi:radical SAM superfamily enzyme YgiQ (UPF0313 family)
MDWRCAAIARQRLRKVLSVKVVLISTYELGHQPFGLASPAAWLRRAGAEVVCLDLSRQSFHEEAVRAADLVAFYVPMHTATRLAIPLIEPVRRLNPRAHLCFYGLYAPVNEAYLRDLGVETIVGGEFEGALTELVAQLADGKVGAGMPQGSDATANPRNGGDTNASKQSTASAARASRHSISLERLNFIPPDRRGLPALRQYAHLLMPEGGFKVAGYTEASRGCKHLCRHCPVVPVYNGVFRIVQRDVVVEDIRRQVDAGAEHITFGDPDFFNGPAHALAIVEAMHREFPQLSYDVTIKIEHLLQHKDAVRTLRDTGCLFATSAVESVDDAILARLAKGHTRADFLAVVAGFRELGLMLQPTFVPFTPWTTLAGYRELLALIAEQDLAENVAPIQLGIRLLIPAGSRLLELEEVRTAIDDFDASGLVYPWKHPDPRMDMLSERVQELANDGHSLKRSRSETFSRIWGAAQELAGQSARLDIVPANSAAPKIPHFAEPWYCCAEPTRDQFAAMASEARLAASPDTFV